jgi:hypothetical protein
MQEGVPGGPAGARMERAGASGGSFLSKMKGLVPR